MLKLQLYPGMNTIKLISQDWKLRYLNHQDGKIMGWFEVLETTNTNPFEHEVYLALTGEEIPDGYQYTCSHQIHAGNRYFLIHAYE